MVSNFCQGVSQLSSFYGQRQQNSCPDPPFAAEGFFTSVRFKPFCAFNFPGTFEVHFFFSIESIEQYPGRPPICSRVLVYQCINVLSHFY